MKTLLRRRRAGAALVLAGMGGVGKTTVALWLATEFRRRRWQVWWVNAADSVSLRGGIVEILRRLDAPESITHQVREGLRQRRRPGHPGRQRDVTARGRHRWGARGR